MDAATLKRTGGGRALKVWKTGERSAYNRARGKFPKRDKKAASTLPF